MNFLEFSSEMNEILNIESTVEELKAIFGDNYYWEGWVDDDESEESIQGLYEVGILNYTPEEVVEALEVHLWEHAPVDDFTMMEYVPILLISGQRAIFILPEAQELPNLENSVGVTLYIDAFYQEAFEVDDEN